MIGGTADLISSVGYKIEQFSSMWFKSCIGHTFSSLIYCSKLCVKYQIMEMCLVAHTYLGFEIWEIVSLSTEYTPAFLSITR